MKLTISLIVITITVLLIILYIYKNKESFYDDEPKKKPDINIGKIITTAEYTIDHKNIDDIKYNFREFILQLIADNFRNFGMNSENKNDKIYDFFSRIKYLDSQLFYSQVGNPNSEFGNMVCDYSYSEECYLINFTFSISKEEMEDDKIKLKVIMVFNSEDPNKFGNELFRLMNEENTEGIKINQHKLRNSLRCYESADDLYQELLKYFNSEYFKDLIKYNCNYNYDYESYDDENDYYPYSNEEKRKAIVEKFNIPFKKNILCLDRSIEGDIPKSPKIIEEKKNKLIVDDSVNYLNSFKTDKLKLIDFKSYLCYLGAYEKLNCMSKPYYYNNITRAHLFHKQKCCFEKQKEKFLSLFCTEEDKKNADVSEMCQKVKNNNQTREKGCFNNLLDGSIDLHKYKNKLCKKINKGRNTKDYNWNKYYYSSFRDKTNNKVCENCNFNFQNYFKCYEGFNGNMYENFSNMNCVDMKVSDPLEPTKKIPFIDDDIGNGKTCSDYAPSYCSGGNITTMYTDVDKNQEQITANKACCVCGGGIMTPKESVTEDAEPEENINLKLQNLLDEFMSAKKYSDLIIGLENIQDYLKKNKDTTQKIETYIIFNTHSLDNFKIHIQNHQKEKFDKIINIIKDKDSCPVFKIVNKYNEKRIKKQTELMNKIKVDKYQDFSIFTKDVNMLINILNSVKNFLNMMYNLKRENTLIGLC